MSRWFREPHLEEGPQGLANLLAEYADCQCSDIRDKLFAFVGIWNADASRPFQVNYSWSELDLLMVAYAYNLEHGMNGLDDIAVCRILQSTLCLDWRTEQVKLTLTSRLRNDASTQSSEYSLECGGTIRLPYAKMALLWPADEGEIWSSRDITNDTIREFLDWMYSFTPANRTLPLQDMRSREGKLISALNKFWNHSDRPERHSKQQCCHFVGATIADSDQHPCKLLAFVSSGGRVGVTCADISNGDVLVSVHQRDSFMGREYFAQSASTGEPIGTCTLTDRLERYWWLTSGTHKASRRRSKYARWYVNPYAALLLSAQDLQYDSISDDDA